VSEKNIISSSLDQPTTIYSLYGVEVVDEAINSAADRGDLNRVVDYIANAESVIRVAGVGLSRALYVALRRWDDLTGMEFPNQAARQDHFEQVMFERTGKVKDTIRRYLLVGRFLETVPLRTGMMAQAEEIKQKLPDRGVGDLIAIAQYEQEHGTLAPTRLLDLARAEDSATLRRYLRQYKGLEEADAPMGLEWLADGTVMVREGAEAEPIGFLRRDLDEGSLQNKGVRRIIKRAGIQEE